MTNILKVVESLNLKPTRFGRPLLRLESFVLEALEHELLKREIDAATTSADIRRILWDQEFRPLRRA
tara:strand:+ start:435 stop:635 length:201 start_codon:yes stop_codon:yes gene_type:complete